MNRRGFLVLGATAAAGVALGRSMITVPGFLRGAWLDTGGGRLVSIDDPFGYLVGDYIRRSDGLIYRIVEIERDSPTGGELAIVDPVGYRRRILGEVAIADPVVEARTLGGEVVDGQMRIYRHNFEHDGRYFHVGTSRPYDPDRELPRRETWHPSFWEKKPRKTDPDPWVERNLRLI